MAGRLQDVIIRGLASARPSATTVAPGTLYFSTDSGVIERSNGTTWESYSASVVAAAIRRQVTLIIDGGGSAITTGIKGYLSLPVAGTWKKWRVLSIDAAATAGNIVIDIWKSDYAGYPPVVGGLVTVADKPTLSGVNKNESIALTSWVTAFTAGDIIGYTVISATTVTKVSLVLEFE